MLQEYVQISLLITNAEELEVFIRTRQLRYLLYWLFLYRSGSQKTLNFIDLNQQNTDCN